jgi:putative endonuclease
MTRNPQRAGPDDRPNDGQRRASGAAGEACAAAFLAGAGYRVIARNLRTRSAEIDVLARRRRLLVAVEVKSRRNHPAPERCVSPAQHARLVRALRELAPRLRPRPLLLRIDVIAVRFPPGEQPEIRHFPGQVLDP